MHFNDLRLIHIKIHISRQQMTQSKNDNSDIKILEAENTQLKSQLDALSRSQAVIEFNMDGTIITANDNFLAAMGYTLNEIKGKHHSMFAEPQYAASAEYKAFWQSLNQGKFASGEYKRLGKGGKEVWIQASYNPLLDINGNPFKVVKYATDVTAQKIQNADFSGQIEAIGKSQAVIEFNMDGTIINANENFLATVGYALHEIKGQHHSMFAEPQYAASAEYKAFWQSLNQGKFDSGEYKRIGKGGKEIWIQASYNPILDLNGRPFKVVKYASNITAQKIKNADYSGQIDAIGKSQAVIEFNMDGTIVNANENFLATLGYSLNEIKGKHHSMFAEPQYAASAEYKAFWQNLNQGKFDSGEYKRIGKGGKEIWIQASYNPILDLNDRPYKVVKYASDITSQKTYQFTVEKLLREASQVMSSVAEGYLNTSMTTKYEGEFAKLCDAINQTVSQLKETVTSIHAGAANISHSAGEISAGNTELSTRTEEQASSLEETASSMEQMTSTVTQNAANSRKATELARSAQDRAGNGGNIVSEAITAMGEINKSSKKIADIISVIDEIAFQTNLLALNAAVEAARAGEQGRGFAVVASEVRNLAQRSASAAKEIKELISDSVRKVSEGSGLVDKTGETLKEIVEAVRDVTDIITEIAAASNEQASGINQVNQAVAQIDQMTQQNAALVEQAAAASQSMSDESNSLIERIQFFKLDDNNGTHTSNVTPIGGRRAA